MYLVMTLEITVIIIKMSLKRVSELRRTNPTHGFINILLMITMDLEKNTIDRTTKNRQICFAIPFISSTLKIWV